MKPYSKILWVRVTVKWPGQKTEKEGHIQSSSEEDIRRRPPVQKKRTRADSTSSPEGQQDKRPAMGEQTEDN